ncbi:MAG: LamG-like jellyroll fold domain-containing protein [Verrucomicrobiota bacterium]
MNPSPPSPACRDPFAAVLDAVVSGEASPRDATLLNDTLRSDPEARRAYIRAMVFEAMLAQEFAPLEEVASAAPARSNRWVAATAVAATILLAATLAWRVGTGTGRSTGGVDNLLEPDQEITHAVITGLDDARGHFGQVALTQGLRLTSGTLELDSGFAEITFDSGAEVTLEGPARLQLESDNKARLAAGRASAHVPEPARGFVIHTPSSYIRDLGTAFAVDVRDNRETDLQVLEGEVEVSAAGGPAGESPKILRQSEAVRLTNGGMRSIRFRADSPGPRRKGRNAKIPTSVHWSLDAWEGDTTRDANRGLLLKLQQKQGAATPATTEGPFGRALHFDGQGTFARADYTASSNAQTRTVVCWLRLQPDAASAGIIPNEVLAWGSKHAPGKWQLAWNQGQGQGCVGAPRVEFGDGFVIGSTDLRDGRWHHLAVVCLGGPKANVASHVRLYVDGRLEALTGRHPRKIDAPASTARSLMLGRHPGRASDREAATFEGDIDEVHIFDGALLPGQIERLMKHNSLRQTK